MNSLVIVGNSESLLQQDLGEWIDAHPLILRMNWGFPSRHPAQLGTRTDILALSCNIEPVQVFAEYDPRLVVVASPKHDMMPNLFDPDLPCADRFAALRIFYPLAWWTELYEQLGQTRPSTGAMMLHACAKLGVCADVVGFDFFQSNSWYNGFQWTGPHKGDVEKRFASTLAEDGRIFLCTP